MDFTNARIYCQMGATINLGNYQSAKALVGLEVDVPTNTTLEEVRDGLADTILDLLHDTLTDTAEYVNDYHK